MASWVRTLLLTLAVLSTLLPARAWALPILSPSRASLGEDVGRAAEILEDRTKTLRIDDVVASGHFRPFDWGHPNMGFTESAYWLRFRVKNDYDEPTTWVLEITSTAARSELHAVKDDGARTRMRSGSDLPFSERIAPHSKILFRMPMAPREEATFYLHMEADDTLVIAPVIRAESMLAEAYSRERLWNGAYYGILVAMILFNLSVFFAVRDRAYLLYVYFQTTFILTQGAIDKLLFQYVWPSWPVWAARSEQFFASLAIHGALLFASHFIDLPSSAPRIARVVRVLAYAGLGFAALSVVTDSAGFKTALAAYLFASMLVLLTAGFTAARKKVANAPYFFAGWLVLVAGSAVSVLASLGVLQSLPLVGPVVLKVGSAAEATLLSLALADRLARTQRERSRAQEEMLALKAAQAQILEQRVEERTRELARAQDAIIRQERLAALGQLVAGVAHEVGNPLNFAQGGARDLAKRMPGDASLALVLEGLKRIANIIGNLRTYMRSGVAETRAIDLVEEIDGTLTLAANTLSARNIEVKKDIQPLPAIECRPGEMGQVFMNLVLNSCAAMPTGGTLTITTRAEGDRIRVELADTGPGIAPEHRHAVFEPFFTGRAEAGGTGLGLYVSHQIVSRHGGELRLAESDEGARFVITLPVGS